MILNFALLIFKSPNEFSIKRDKFFDLFFLLIDNSIASLLYFFSKSSIFSLKSLSDLTNEDNSSNSFLIKPLFSITDSIEPPYFRFKDSNTDIRSSINDNLVLSVSSLDSLDSISESIS